MAAFVISFNGDVGCFYFTALKVYNQSVFSDTPSADKNLVTACFSSLVQTERGVAMLPLKQSHYRPEWPRGFQEVKVPRFRDNGSGWW